MYKFQIPDNPRRHLIILTTKVCKITRRPRPRNERAQERERERERETGLIRGNRGLGHVKVNLALKQTGRDLMGRSRTFVRVCTDFAGQRVEQCT